MKKLTFFLAIGTIAVPLFVSAQVDNSALIAQLQAQKAALEAKIQQLQASQGQAQSGAVGGGGGGGSAGIPISLPMSPTPPVIYEDFDDIVQFNNLIIRSVSGPSFPAEIKASYEVGVRCQKFQSESAGGVEYACPLSPSVLYTIKLDSDTRLLLRNRQRASLADFGVGDRINVYGFTDSGVSSLDALVVRNLTKPVRLSFIQLNNMEALSAPSSGVSPKTFTVVNKYFSPCRDFSDGPNSGVTLPCPLGLEIQEQPQQQSSVGVGQLYYPSIRKYLIEVTRQTTILQRDRSPMSLSDIAVGDILNIYGSYDDNSQNIQAIVMRDLSKPVQNHGSLQVSVNDANTRCLLQQSPSQSVQSGGGGAGGGGSSIVAPCGTLYGAQVDLYDASGAFIGPQTTERGAAFFENLRAGEYTIVASAIGYDKSKTSVSVGAGKVTFATVNLLQLVPQPFPTPTPFPTPMPPNYNQTPVISGVKGPTALKVGETGTWSVSAYDPENGQLSYKVVWGDEGTNSASLTQPPSLAPVQQTTTFTHSYSREGNYTPVFYVADNQGLTAKTSISVNVGATTPQPTGYLYLSPSSLSVGVGEQQKIQAFYQPPMPPCPSDFPCPVYIPAPLHAIWSSSNANVAKVLADPSGTVPSATVTGVSVGTAEIQAAFTQYPNSYTAKATVEVRPTSQPSITVISPNGGESWQRGTTQTIQWNDNTPTIAVDCLVGAYCPPPAPKMYEIRLLAYTPPCTTNLCPAYAIAPYTIAKSVQMFPFYWSVGKTLDLDRVAPDGAYTVQVCQSGGDICDSSDSYFKITSATSQPSITVLSPNGGENYKTGDKLFVSWGGNYYI